MTQSSVLPKDVLAKKAGECFSMTGYSQARSEQNGWAVRVSVKSVNHRFLDLKLRLPEGFDLYELRLRLSFGRIFTGIICPSGLASPTGFEPVF